MLVSAIADGVLNNDAFKNVDGESMNESWTNLIKDLKFFDKTIEDHTLYLRRRFVIGAKEWMAGMHGSKQNDKLLFDYSDSDWEYIWSTMLKDKAWAVPSVKDKDGKTVKANFAPEILIKYIAHELKSHIIVFDLLLNRVQYLSGNHIKDNNVVFDSPLLLYNTGGHFQSVFQQDHEYFIRFAKELEAENNGSTQGLTSKGGAQGQGQKPVPSNSVSDPNQPRIDLLSSSKRKMEKVRLEANKSKSSENQNMQAQLKSAKRLKCKETNTDVQKHDFEFCLNTNNRFQLLDVEPDSIDARIEVIKSIKPRNRTPEQKKELRALYQRRLREKEKEETKNARNDNNRKRMQLQREKETEEMVKVRKEKDRVRKQEQRNNETVEMAEIRKEKKRVKTQEQRKMETEEMAKVRKEKVKVRTQEQRKKDTVEMTETRKEKKRVSAQEQRKNETKEMAKVWKEKDRVSTQQQRNKETEERAKVRKEKDRVSTQQQRNKLGLS